MKYSTVKPITTLLAGASYLSMAVGILTTAGSAVGGIGWLAAAFCTTVLERRLSVSARFRTATKYPEGPLPDKPNVVAISGPLVRDFWGQSQTKIENNVQYVLVGRLDSEDEWVAVAALGGTDKEKKFAVAGTHLPDPKPLKIALVGKDPKGIFADKALADWVGWDGKSVSRTWDQTGLHLLIPVCNSMTRNKPDDFKYCDINGQPLKGDIVAYGAAGKPIYYQTMRIVVDGAGAFTTGSMVGIPAIQAVWD